MSSADKFGPDLEVLLGYLAGRAQLARGYELYLGMLCQLTGRGYTGTITCPGTNGSPREWSNFHLVLAREITAFTQPAPLPAALVSGGSLNGSAARNQEFLSTFSSTYWESDYLCLCLGGEGLGMLCEGAKGGTVISEKEIKIEPLGQDIRVILLR